MTKATDSGHCQACGSLQKLPAGRLSLHGYNVTHGFFSGTCVGARELPFELSCDLVARFVARAEARLADVVAFQASLRAPATSRRAWVHNYQRTAARGRGGYVWIEVDIIVKEDADGRRAYSYVADGLETGSSRVVSRTKQITDYDYGRKPEVEFLTALNAKYAGWLEHEAESLRRYIAWQAERVATWVPAPLLPVDARDKAGFAPTAPAYAG